MIPTKLIIAGIIIALVGGGSFFLYQQHVGMVEKIAEQKELIVQQKLTIDTLELEIKSIEEDIDNKDNEFKLLIDRERDSRARMDMLEYRLTKKHRDIGVLARKKPRPVEKVITNASNQRMRCFEIASGSTLTEEDYNAKAKKRLTVCPQLVPDIIVE